MELPLLYRGLTVREARVRSRQVMEWLGVADLADRLPGRMSGGQQQSVAICRALVGEPDLILADEPTGNLDSTWAAGIADLLLLANRGGATLLVATHDPWLASKAHRRVHLVDGCIAPS